MPAGDLVVRVYSGFRGVDFRTEEANLTRSPDALNVWKDYKKSDSLRTRPSISLFKAFNEPVYGIFYFKLKLREMYLIHSGTKLYKIENGVTTELFTGLSPSASQSFVNEKIFYLKDGINYLQYDGDIVKEVEGFVPMTSIGRKPSGGGSQYQDVNLLSPYRINGFAGDGKSTEFFLDAKNIDADYAPEVTVNDKRVPSVTVNPAAGKITFAEAPPEPFTTGRDNVFIKFRKTVEGHRERITKCKLLQVFDNRIFFAGNPNYPNTLFHSSLFNPSYVSDTDYYPEGMDLSPIKSIVAGNNALWVLKEPAHGDTTVFYHNPVIDADVGKIYPSTHSSISIGCVAAATNFNDDIVFLSQRGLEGVHGDVTTEQLLAHRSSTVDGKLLSDPNYKKIILEEFEGYLLCFAGNKVYLADSRGKWENIDHYEYEWFYWELPEEVMSTQVIDGVLYLGTKTGIYTLEGQDAVRSYWTTAKDKFNNPQYLKTTNKKGCVVEAEGDLKLSVATNKTDFEEVGTFNNVADFLVGRIKRKKFKDIQLKFSSDTRFTLDSASMECYIGGYIKR